MRQVLLYKNYYIKDPGSAPCSCLGISIMRMLVILPSASIMISFIFLSCQGTPDINLHSFNTILIIIHIFSKNFSSHSLLILIATRPGNQGNGNLEQLEFLDSRKNLCVRQLFRCRHSDFRNFLSKLSTLEPLESLPS